MRPTRTGNTVIWGSMTSHEGGKKKVSLEMVLMATLSRPNLQIMI